MRIKTLIFLFLLFNYSVLFSQKLTIPVYLQQLGPHSTFIEFRTKTDLKPTLYYYMEGENEQYQITEKTYSKIHSIKINHLESSKRYFYSIDLGNGTLLSDSTYFFKTAPETGSKEPFNFWMTGDTYFGEEQFNVRDGFKKFIGNKYVNLFLTAGDNVYGGGSVEDYQEHFFSVYKQISILRQSGLFPAIGNHDYEAISRNMDDPNVGYFNVFNLPEKGELGGIPSGSEAYYSFDYGNVHFIVLDDYAYDPYGKRIYDGENHQKNWLIQDLSANNQDWTIVYFHYPPYTKGTYDSDSQPELIQIREALVPIFDEFKVDFVISAHSHIMERSKPTIGLIEKSNEFVENIHHPQTSSGLFNGLENSCPYFFNIQEPEDYGPIYIVNGSSGSKGISRTNSKHPIMYYQGAGKSGSFYAEIDSLRFDGKFIGSDGSILDQFTVFKSKDGSCKDCFEGYKNYGCGPSGPPELVKNNFEICQNDSINNIVIKLDSNSETNWYDSSLNLIGKNDFNLDSNNAGEKIYYLSSTVNQYESRKILLKYTVNKRPVLHQEISTPEVIYENNSTLFSIENQVDILKYNWSWPSIWELISIDKNQLTLIPKEKEGEIFVSGTSDKGCLSNQVSKKIEFSKILGINSEDNVKIFPNPSFNGLFLLKVNQELIGNKYEIINLNGAIVVKGDITSDSIPISMNSSPSGIYFLKINNTLFKLLNL